MYLKRRVFTGKENTEIKTEYNVLTSEIIAGITISSNT
jgi:hypothetical protein